jgi:hypothetical protein
MVYESVNIPRHRCTCGKNLRSTIGKPLKSVYACLRALSKTQLILAVSLISIILPLTISFLAQRVYIQEIVITGVDK